MRLLFTLLLMAAAVAAAVLIANQPGHVAIFWQDRRIDAPVAVLIAAVIAAALILAALIWLLRRILGGPGAFLRRRRERRRREGYRALTQGMVAVAAGDAEEARRQARKADALLAEPPLTLLLSAQAAQLNGDEDAAKKYFAAMLERGETEFLGLRGLLTQALKRGDEATALRLAERAQALRPRTPWVLTSLFELRTRRGDWRAAEASLAEAGKAKLLPEATLRRHRAALLHEESKAAEAAGDSAAALSLARKAQDLAPDFAPAAARHALLLHRAGRDRQAAKALEAAWRRAPHPLLAEACRTLAEAEPALARFKRIATLAAAAPEHVESRIALAEAALEAQLWGEARRHLEAAGAGAGPGTEVAPPAARICRLMARLEEAEHGDGAAARAWLARIGEAPPDPLYVCAACAAESRQWQPLCPRCRAFDSFEWQSPARALPALPEPSAGSGATGEAKSAEAPHLLTPPERRSRQGGAVA
ncbi:MAG TPA: heme biosynthesis HemY N-terminal domain-containing protein [Stellaceae bacterium]|nr:heme biosynthesis HemY N-terminal domain-containing protein [Stellaceae bacterium]